MTQQANSEGKNKGRPYRIRGRSEARQRLTQTKKETAIQLTKAGKTEKEITNYLALDAVTIKGWLYRDPGFKSRWQEALDCVVMEAKGKLANSLPDAVGCIQGTVRGEQTNKLAYAAAEGQVRGLGVYNSAPVVAVDNSNHEYKIVVQWDGNGNTGKDRPDSPPETPTLPAG